jgi:SAM-dependent methyltransferase
MGIAIAAPNPMLTAVQYELLRRIRPTDPTYLAASAYEGRSKLETLFGALLGDVSGLTIVDFGCGDGLEAVDLARRGAARVYGIDTNVACLDMARWQADHAGLSHVIELSDEAAPALSADLAISVDSFEHYADPAAILRLLHRLLRPGGVLLVSFGPPWRHPYGGHLFSVYPWAHLLFSEAALVRWREGRREDGAGSFAEAGLNRMTVGRFERLVDESPFDVEVLEAIPIRRARRLYNPLTREFLTSTVRARLVKRGHGSLP